MVRSLEPFYHIDGDQFECQNKEHLSGYKSRSELAHAQEWLVSHKNIGPSLCIDEISMTNGDLYAFIANRAMRRGKGSFVAVVNGVSSDAVIKVLGHMPEVKHEEV